MSATATVTEQAWIQVQPAKASSGSVKTKLNYYLPAQDGTFPSANNLELILGDVDQETREIEINDVRDHPEVDWSKTVDTTGFAFIKRTDWTYVNASQSDDEIDNGQYPKDLEDTVFQLFPNADRNTTKIHHLSFIFRGQSGSTTFTNAAATSNDPAWNKPNRGSAPAGRVHIDFSRRGLAAIVGTAFGQDSEATRMATDPNAGKRMVCLSLWRPLKTVHRDPFTVCDCRSVKPSHLAKIPRTWPNGDWYERVAVKASGTPGGECEHKWYYMSNQTPEDLCVVKICDTANGWTNWEQSGSDEDPVGCTPHCAFKVPGTEHMDVRESIEWRVIIFMDE